MPGDRRRAGEYPHVRGIVASRCIEIVIRAYPEASKATITQVRLGEESDAPWTAWRPIEGSQSTTWDQQESPAPPSEWRSEKGGADRDEGGRVRAGSSFAKNKKARLRFSQPGL